MHISHHPGRHRALPSASPQMLDDVRAMRTTAFLKSNLILRRTNLRWTTRTTKRNGS